MERSVPCRCSSLDAPRARLSRFVCEDLPRGATGISGALLSEDFPMRRFDFLFVGCLVLSAFGCGGSDGGGSGGGTGGGGAGGGTTSGGTTSGGTTSGNPSGGAGGGAQAACGGIAGTQCPDGYTCAA